MYRLGYVSDLFEPSRFHSIENHHSTSTDKKSGYNDDGAADDKQKELFECSSELDSQCTLFSTIVGSSYINDSVIRSFLSSVVLGEENSNHLQPRFEEIDPQLLEDEKASALASAGNGNYTLKKKQKGPIIGLFDMFTNLQKFSELDVDIVELLQCLFRVLDKVISVGIYYGIYEYAVSSLWGVNPVPVSKPYHNGIFAREINKLLWKYSNEKVVFHVLMPIGLYETAPNGLPNGLPNNEMLRWDLQCCDYWTEIKAACDNHPRLKLALSLPSLLDSQEKYFNERIVAHWQQEDYTMIFLPISNFQSHSGDYYSDLARPPPQKMQKIGIQRSAAPCQLSKSAQESLLQLLKFRTSTKVILWNKRWDGPGSGCAFTGNRAKIAPALQNLQQTIFNPKYHYYAQYSAIEKFGYHYWNKPLDPMQPLSDNLPDTSYEVFMQDNIKYKRYESAITLALLDLASEEYLNILLVGPGKGPILDALLRSLNFVKDRLARDGNEESFFGGYNIVLIDKNPHVIYPLQFKIKTQWPEFHDKIEVLHGDVRETYLSKPDKFPANSKNVKKEPLAVSLTKDSHCSIKNSSKNGFDLTISELIGSFGCNELMPECLSLAKTRLIKQHTGVFIPQSIESHVIPVHAPQIHTRIKTDSEFSTGGNAVSSSSSSSSYAEKLSLSFAGCSFSSLSPSMMTSMTSEKLQRPYVCMLLLLLLGGGERSDLRSREQTAFLADTALKVWQFSYANNSVSGRIKEVSDNDNDNGDGSRITTVQFDITKSSILHGFGGYFRSVLYLGIELSIVPHLNPTKNLVLWFPVFFPLTNPVWVQQDTRLELSMVRDCIPGTRVWYEWSVKLYRAVSINSRSLLQQKKEKAVDITTKPTPKTPKIVGASVNVKATGQLPENIGFKNSGSHAVTRSENLTSGGKKTLNSRRTQGFGYDGGDGQKETLVYASMIHNGFGRCYSMRL